MGGNNVFEKVGTWFLLAVYGAFLIWGVLTVYSGIMGALEEMDEGGHVSQIKQDADRGIGTLLFFDDLVGFLELVVIVCGIFGGLAYFFRDQIADIVNPGPRY